MAEDSYYLKTIGNTLDLINVFIEQRRPLTIAEIINYSGLDRATTNRIVYTLAKENFFVKKEKKYSLSVKVLDLGDAYLASNNILQAAQDEINELANQYGELVTLYINRSDRNSMLYYCEPPTATYHHSQMSHSMPRNCTSVGKVFLSQYSDGEIRTIMEKEGFVRNTEKSICEIEPLLEEVHFVQKNGYATCVGEYTLDTGAIGIPVVDDSGEILFALSFSYGASMTQSRLDLAIPGLLEAGKRLTSKLKYVK